MIVYFTFTLGALLPDLQVFRALPYVSRTRNIDKLFTLPIHTLREGVRMSRDDGLNENPDWRYMKG